MSDTDLQLLARYTRQHAEEAFAELVRRHLDLVFSAALRQVRSPQLAEEVAQSAFTDLARQAHRLAPYTILTAWLYQVTRRTAIDVVRRESRRQHREQIACELNAMNTPAADWIHIEPLLDEAMQALEEADRTAVLLRYFENKSLREVGQTLGTNEDAARKRVSRAVERLREFFAKRGVTLGTSGLVIALSANAVQTSPAGLAVTICTAAALAGTTAATTATATATVTKAIAMTTLQKTLIGATLAAAVGAGVYEAHQASTLRGQVQTLRQQQAPLADQIQQLQQEREEATRRLASLREDIERLNRNAAELLRLRGEAGVLRNMNHELEKLLASLPTNSQTSTATQDSATNDYFPRASWKFTGYATPEASFRSSVFAISKGDIQAVLGSYVPEVRAMQEKEWEKTPEAKLKDQLVNGTLDIIGFRIVRKDTISGDEVFLTVSTATEGKGERKERIRLKKVSDEWKIDPRRFDPLGGQYK